ncbi:MAG: GNAT family N-acetyltransferase [Rhodoblastus sp.]
MATEVIELQYSDASLAEMFEVGRAAFGHSYNIEQLQNNWRLGDDRTTFYGIVTDGKLIAFNGFMAHAARRGDRPLVLFQSGHSATHPDHRRKGLFQKLINHAKSSLDGDYIVGFPNDKSKPIFVEKLGFSLAAMRRVWLPCFGSRYFLNARQYISSVRAADMIHPDEAALAKWKWAEHERDVFSVEEDSAIIWGRLTTRRIGITKFRVLVVGGFQAPNVDILSSLLMRVSVDYGARFAQFIVCIDSPIVSSARISLSGDKTEPFIWFPLRESPPSVSFAACVGMKDAY